MSAVQRPGGTGDGEWPRTLALSEADRRWLADAGVPVRLRITEGQDAHTLPRDFAQELVGWVEYGLGRKLERVE